MVALQDMGQPRGLGGRRGGRVDHVNFAETGQNRLQEFVFVFDNHEETGIVAEEFDGSAQGRLGVLRQIVGVGQDDGLELGLSVGIVLNVHFGKGLDFLADEFDAAPRAIDKQSILLDFLSVASVDAADKGRDEGLFATVRFAVENNVGDFSLFAKKV